MAQCAATAERTGEPCRAPAVTGEERCVFHRGRAPSSSSPPADPPATDPAPEEPEGEVGPVGLLVVLGLAAAAIVRMLRGG